MNEPENKSEDTAEVVVETTPESEVEAAASPEVVTEEVATEIEASKEEVVAVIETEPVEEAHAEVAAVETTKEGDVTETVVVSEVVTKPEEEKTIKAKVKWQYYAVAVAVVVILLGGLVYIMEQQGRLQTNVFSGIQKMVTGKKSVATVNSAKITQSDLNISISQITAGAAAQGADVKSEEVKGQIQTQAIDMLVNTELLKQEATARGISVTDEAVLARLETLKTDVGGEEVLATRMKEFSIDQKTLLRDIKNELTIQALLESVFAKKEITVTEEEVTALYAQAGGEAGGLPPLAEVKPQIEAQIKSTKEQEIVTQYVDELRAKATVEVLI